MGNSKNKKNKRFNTHGHVYRKRNFPVKKNNNNNNKEQNRKGSRIVNMDNTQRT